jgi:hypothetical protein
MQHDERIQNIINQQGWDDDSVKGLLLNFVRENGLTDKLVEFLYEVADEENDGSIEVDEDGSQVDADGFCNTCGEQECEHIDGED